MSITCGNKVQHGEHSHATVAAVRACYAGRYGVKAVVTTLTKWKGKRVGNYCSLPTIDVPVIEEPKRECAKCRAEVRWDERSYRHVHVDISVPDHGYISVLPTCHYCGTNDPAYVSLKQYPWHDATECTRCGGSTGYAIGD